MSNTKVQMPGQGAVARIPVQTGDALAFAFDADKAQCSVEGKDLVVTVDGAGSVVLEGLFALPAAQMPALVLTDGTAVGAADYLNSINPELMTAAGPAAATASLSGGAGSYSDDAGASVGGVERLGDLGADQWNGASQTVDPAVGARSASLRADAPQLGFQTPTLGEGPVDSTTPAPIEPAAPVTPLAPSGPVDGQYVSRAVLYKTGTDSGDALTFEVLSNGMPARNIDPNSVGVAAAGGWTEKFFDLEHSAFDPATGRMTLTLTQAGKDALAENRADFYEYVTVTVGGASYNMQLVINRTGSFDSAHENLLTSDGFSLQTGLSEVVWGEWHNADGGSGKGARSSAGGNDSVTFLSSGTAVSGSVLATGDGNDHIVISGKTGVLSSTVEAGAGSDTLSISGTGGNAVYKSVINTNADAVGDVISFNGGKNAAMYDKAVLNAGDGADVVTISNDADSEAAIMNYSSEINLGGGADTLIITGGKAGTNSAINAGDGDDVIIMRTKGAWQGAITLGAGDDKLDIATAGATGLRSSGVDANTPVDLGTGADTIKISSENGWAAAHLHSTTAAGDDKGDTYIFNGGTAWTPADGTPAGGVKDSTINAGNGNDTFSITGTGAALSVSTITAGEGKDTFVLTSTASVGMNGSVIDATADAVGDSYTITAKGDGMYASSILGGAGADTILIESGGSGLSRHSGIDNGQTALIDTGAGDDRLTIIAGGAGVNARGIVDMGEGHDTLYIEAAKGNSLATIEGGAGDDHMHLKSGNAAILYNSTLDGGSGHDTIVLEGNLSLNAGNSSVSGGEGSDLIMLRADAGAGIHSGLHISGGEGGDAVTFAHGHDSLAHVGDILGLSGNLANSLSASAVTASTAAFLPNVSGFEALMVDYNDATKDTINLDRLLNTVDKLNDTNDISSIVIKAGVNDILPDLGGHNVTHTTENVTIAGLGDDQHFTQYTINHHGEEMQIYIQTVLAAQGA